MHFSMRNAISFILGYFDFTTDSSKVLSIYREPSLSFMPKDVLGNVTKRYQTEDHREGRKFYGKSHTILRAQRKFKWTFSKKLLNSKAIKR